jgi:hypothetical protein
LKLKFATYGYSYVEAIINDDMQIEELGETHGLILLSEYSDIIFMSVDDWKEALLHLHLSKKGNWVLDKSWLAKVILKNPYRPIPLTMASMEMLETLK